MHTRAPLRALDALLREVAGGPQVLDVGARVRAEVPRLRDEVLALLPLVTNGAGRP